MQLKWGIVAAGQISSDFVTAVKGLPTNEHKIIAIASRSQDSADKFAQTHGIPNAYEGYDKLAKNEHIDIVYVGCLNPQHYEVTKLLLEAGKHVLCEKPFTLNEKQTRKLISISKEKKLFLMEAIWSRCFPAYKEMKRLIDSGHIGEVKEVSVEFGVPVMQHDRLKYKELGGGTILDLGVYTLQFQQFVFRGLKPIKVVAHGNLNEDGVDSSAAAIITYPSGRMAVCASSGVIKNSCEGRVYGTKGSIRMPTVWCPTSLIVNGETVEFPLIQNDGKFNLINSAGLAYEAEEARRCIMEGWIESSQITHEETIQLAQLMDKMRADVGVVFPADSKPF